MPMTNEASGHDYKGRRPAGRSIVEERGNNCKLTVWAQDLKANASYDIFLLFKDSERYAGIKMGTLAVDEKGKGEVRCELGLVELGHFKLENIAAVAINAKGTTEIVSPLCGYKGETVAWRHKFYEYKRSIVAYKSEEVPPNDEPSTEDPPNDETHVIVPIVEENSQQLPPVEEPPHVTDDMPVTDTDNALAADSIHAMCTTHANENHPIMPDPTPTPPVDTDLPQDPVLPEHEEAIPTAESTPAPHTEEQPQPYDPTPIRQFTHAQEPKSEIAKSFRIALDQLHADTIQRSAEPAPQHNIETLFATKESVVPFQRQSRKTNWIRFDLSDNVPPPTNKPHLFKDPFVQKALAEYGHLILGMTEAPGPKRYIIGVPDNPCQVSKQKARRLGFTQFKHCDELHPEKSDFGYWLMFTTP